MGRIHDAISRNGTNFQRMLLDKETSGPCPESSEAGASVEPLFESAKFGRAQIAQQDLPELREGLMHIEAAISDPVGWLGRCGAHDVHGTPGLSASELRPMLAQRKRLMLRRIDLLVNSSKIQKIRQLAGGISDRRARAAIFKELSELLAKDEIIEAEYRRLDADYPSSAPEVAPGFESKAPAAGARIFADRVSSTGGFAAVPAGALLLTAAALTAAFFSWRPSLPGIFLAAPLLLAFGTLVRREWRVPRRSRRR